MDSNMDDLCYLNVGFKIALTREILKNMTDSLEFKHHLITIAKEMIDCIKNGNKIMFIGNGGSAADAQHFAAELVNRFLINRAPLPGLALTTDTSTLTSIANDFSYDFVFSKQVEALGNPGDILFCLSTSGTSPNILTAINSAKTKKIKTIILTGEKGSYLLEQNIVDLAIIIPSKETPRIQECGLVVGHLLFEIIEDTIFNKGDN